MEGNISKAGSFGGFLKVRGEDHQGRVFRLTAAHCLPDSVEGTAVCSPSTVEVTGRFRNLHRYTSFAEPNDRLHQAESKEAEATELLNQIGFNNNNAPIDHNEVLSGARLGTVVLTRFEDRGGILATYDRVPEGFGRATFGASPDMLMTLDYAIMSIVADR